MSYVSCSDTSKSTIGSLSAFLSSAATSIIPSPVLWLDANNPLNNGTHPANETPLPEWVDKSSSGNDFSQAVVANQPIFISNGINGLPLISFDTASGSYFMDGDIIDLEEYTIFLVGDTFSIFSDPVSTFFYNGDSAANGQGLMAVTAGTGNIGLLYGGVNSLSDGAQDPAIPHIFIAQFDGTTSRFYIDNVLQALTNSTAVPLAPTGKSTLGSNTTGGDLLNGEIAEVLVYNTNLSAFQRSVVWYYLQQKWATPAV